MNAYCMGLWSPSHRSLFLHQENDFKKPDYVLCSRWPNLALGQRSDNADLKTTVGPLDPEPPSIQYQKVLVIKQTIL